MRLIGTINNSKLNDDYEGRSRSVVSFMSTSIAPLANE